MDLSTHPCFDAAARLKYSRVHLPVAPGCNVQCNFCDRRFDCANESRPGVTSTLLTPEQAADYVDEVVERDPSMRVVGIAGPGDPLAMAGTTLDTLRRVRERHHEMLLCVATNGLGLPASADALADLAVSHVTVTVNAVDPRIGAKVYEWIKDGKQLLTGVEGAELLLSRQIEGIQKLVSRNVLVKVNSILIPGVNDGHIPEVARRVGALGAERFNCMPLRPVPGTRFGALEEPPKHVLHAVRAEAGTYVEQMEHCARCRADAVGRIGHRPTEAQLVVLRSHAKPKQPVKSRVAVASQEGILVNQHLGEAFEFQVFEPDAAGYAFVETREAPDPGSGSERWQELANVLFDCCTVLVSNAGDKPKSLLAAKGIEVHATDGLIEEALEALREGRALAPARSEKMSCGKGLECNGTGLACG